MTFITTGFGLANVVAALLVLTMPYNRYNRTIPLILVIQSVASWVLFVFTDVSDATMGLIPMYLFLDILVMSIAISACLEKYGRWKFFLLGNSVLSFFVGTTIYIYHDQMTTFQVGLSALINNMCYGFNILLIIYSAFLETIRRAKIKSRNKTNYFKEAR